MAKDLVSSLGNAELNALMAVQLNKLTEVNKSLRELFEKNNCIDFNSAYQSVEMSANFMSKRNQLLDELSAILEVMDKLRVAQQVLMKNRTNEQE